MSASSPPPPWEPRSCRRHHCWSYSNFTHQSALLLGRHVDGSEALDAGQNHLRLIIDIDLVGVCQLNFTIVKLHRRALLARSPRLGHSSKHPGARHARVPQGRPREASEGVSAARKPCASNTNCTQMLGGPP